MEKVRHKIEAAFPGIAVEMMAGSSRGDALQNIPLQTVEGSDFFTQEIFEKLTTGEADIAVHSLKDMSAEHFFGNNIFAVVDRDDARDVAIFRKQVLEKIKNGETVVIGTCSPRREEMATGFLQKALPQFNQFQLTTKFIRGNVDTRLRKLEAGEYDGIILATAGLNRLLNSEGNSPGIKNLLKDKLLMILPLIECVPAPCQGAIVAEAHPSNEKAKKILQAINETELTQDCIEEKKIAGQYGKGCLQKFGVTTISFDNRKIIYAAGKDASEENFSKWYGLPQIPADEKNVFNASDFIGTFFQYEYFNADYRIKQPVVYVSNYKAIVNNSSIELPNDEVSDPSTSLRINSRVDNKNYSSSPTNNSNSLIEQLQQKKVWAAGTKTWFELAKKGIWVEGCADALGLESLRQAFNMPLLNIATDDVCVITNKQSEQTWRQKGWHVIATYSLQEKENDVLKSFFSDADIIFWTSYRQYEQYKSVLKENVVHSCPAGETAELLRTAGIEPVVFPTIKSFQQWRKSSIPSRNAA
jgi:hydroxymethylbilane synthase